MQRCRCSLAWPDRWVAMPAMIHRCSVASFRQSSCPSSVAPALAPAMAAAITVAPLAAANVWPPHNFDRLYRAPCRAACWHTVRRPSRRIASDRQCRRRVANRSHRYIVISLCRMIHVRISLHATARALINSPI